MLTTSDTQNVQTQDPWSPKSSPALLSLSKSKKYPGPTNSYTTLDSQLNWIIDELDGKENKAKIALSKTRSAEQAAEIFDSTYERSNGASREQRKLYAKDIYNKILANVYK